jgi:hypothetical protein
MLTIIQKEAEMEALGPPPHNEKNDQENIYEI